MMSSVKTWLTYWVGSLGIIAITGIILIIIEIFGNPSGGFLAVAIIAMLAAGNLWARHMGVSLWSDR